FLLLFLLAAFDAQGAVREDHLDILFFEPGHIGCEFVGIILLGDIDRRHGAAHRLPPPRRLDVKHRAAPGHAPEIAIEILEEPVYFAVQTLERDARVAVQGPARMPFPASALELCSLFLPWFPIPPTCIWNTDLAAADCRARFRVGAILSQLTESFAFSRRLF